LPSVQESLAGRITKLRLRPLCQGEKLRVQPAFLEAAFKGDFKAANTHYDKDVVLGLAMSGGYPEAMVLDDRNRKKWHTDYITAILEHDLKDITQIHRHDAMQSLVKILAAWSSKFMNMAQIGSGLSIKQQALISYMNALEALYIIDRVKPWRKTDYDRVGKQDKLFMADTGLMASLLGWNKENVRFDDDKSGKIIETLVYNELAVHVDVADSEYELLHYRDRQQREIDFIIEREDSALLGIEVKSGSNIGAKDFMHLKWFSENLSGVRPFTGIILYSGEHVASFGDNMVAVPYSCLWS